MYVSFFSNLRNVLFQHCNLFSTLELLGSIRTILARLVGVFILWKELSAATVALELEAGWELYAISLLPAAGERLMMRAGDVVMIAYY